MKTITMAVLAAVAMAAASSAFAAETVTAPLLTVAAEGKGVTFSQGGAEVEAKVSGKRTKVTIAGAAADRSHLKAGMTCTIEYEPGGDNEVSAIDCK